MEERLECLFWILLLLLYDSGDSGIEIGEIGEFFATFVAIFGITLIGAVLTPTRACVSFRIEKRVTNSVAALKC